MAVKKVIDKKINTSSCQKDRALTEVKLISAAEKIFSIHGYDGATTRMIAQEADVNIALINRYFDGKFGLLLKIIEIKSIEFNKSTEDTPTQKTFSKECFQYLLSRLRLHHKDENFFKIVVVQYLTDATFAKKFRDLIVRNDDRIAFIERIQALQKQKKVELPMPIENFIDSLLSYMFGAFIGDYIIKRTPYKTLELKIEEFVYMICKPYER